jgi:hypothetical protein
VFRRLTRKAASAERRLRSALGLAPRKTLPDPIDRARFDALYRDPLPSASRPLHVYHLGHSLVGRDMPAMLAQLAGEGHVYASQLGWGATLQSHWEPDVPVKGFEAENIHPQYRDPVEALASGDYDSMVLTEMVEIRDALAYFDSPLYLHRFANAAWTGNPHSRVYLYETWHELDDPEGWLNRIDLDLDRYWETALLRVALACDSDARPVHVIPGGQVMAAFARKLADTGGIGETRNHRDLFSDEIHFNDLGAYLIALTHFAVLYGRSPVGLPHQMIRADGSPAEDPGPEVARAMQDTVWKVVTAYPPTGVAIPPDRGS